MASSDTIRIGMIGAGTVGGGVYEIIHGRLGQQATSSSSIPIPSKGFTNLSLRPCVISKICVRDINKARSFQIDNKLTSVTTDINDIIYDENIDIVLELIGGVDLAKTVVIKSLKLGKSVVSANKVLIAECLDEIKQAALVGDGYRQTYFAYEAAVCGGIPIIQAMQGCFSGDIIHKVMGICNGTTNFMLGKMEKEGSDYNEILKDTQDLGFADPTTNAEGHDIAILAKLAFGTTVPVESIPCMGIREISSVDFEYAKLLNCTIKLLGTAERLSEYGEYDGALSVYVSPKVVPLTQTVLSTVHHIQNVVSLKSANTGLTSFQGLGAGRYTAANSVVADICRIASGNSSRDPFPLSSNIELDNNYSSAFYIRITFQDELGIIRRVGELAERNGVSVCSVLQNPIKDRMSADFVVTTEECRYSQVQAMCEDIGKEDFAHNIPLFMPMLND